MKEEVKLLKGNEAIALGAMHFGCDAYFGYPITPQSEILESLVAWEPWKKSGMTVLQAESEIASINMVFGAAGCGKRAMTTSSSPGISLMSEGLSYIAGAELPALIVNVTRSGPGLGGIHPSQADYFLATKGGGHGDFYMITLAPSTVQEMYDFVGLGFDLAFKYRMPTMILADGLIGQMMEKCRLREPMKRLTEEEIREKYGSWATLGKRKGEKNRVVTSLDIDPYSQEKLVIRLRDRFEQLKAQDTRYEEYLCTDAEWLMVAFGSVARIAKKAVDILRTKGIKAGILRPITLLPFPSKRINELSQKLKGVLVPEMSLGQLIQDVKLAINGATAIYHFGRYGGVVPLAEEIADKLMDLQKQE